MASVASPHACLCSWPTDTVRPPLPRDSRTQHVASAAGPSVALCGHQAHRQPSGSLIVWTWPQTLQREAAALCRRLGPASALSPVLTVDLSQLPPGQAQITCPRENRGEVGCSLTEARAARPRPDRGRWRSGPGAGGHAPGLELQDLSVSPRGRTSAMTDKEWQPFLRGRTLGEAGATGRF